MYFIQLIEEKKHSIKLTHNKEIDMLYSSIRLE
jgi:hypothetical protein